MEITLKNDARRELRRGDGTLLLHDEEEHQGAFLPIPVWETVEDADIMTPRDVYDKIINNGYQVSGSNVYILSNLHRMSRWITIA
jgi:hypothetical protein